jgi:predicted ATPase/class 3 adenylate cyclase
VAELPSGTVTFLFTDLEGSTRLWEEYPDAMRDALARHNELLREAIEGHSGYVVKTTGDGFHAAFAAADAGVSAAVAAQRALAAATWGDTGTLRVRMGLHTGVASLRDGDYFGSSLNRAARLMCVAHGGQVVCSQATTDLAREVLTEGVDFVDLGEHRLRDLSRAEHVFQVCAPGLVGEFAPLASLDAFPGNMPLQMSSFIGREREIDQTAAALSEARVVTLTGVGGVGKTRLALQVAAEELPRFREGAWLIELAPVRDPDDVVDAVAAVLGVTARAGQTLVEALVEFLGTKQLLLVVDNCEHVLGPVADLVENIGRSCPGVFVLATSREGLAIVGERIQAVPSLASPTADAEFDAVAASDAVQLFLDRAHAADGAFALGPGNAASVARVCRRLDGVPLAIELAAARVSLMSPAELASALDHRFEVLAGGRRGAVKQQQTLRATIDWSYDLLDESQQRLLARLSVFAGGATRKAAEAVCAGAPMEARAVFGVLGELVARSLVVAERGGLDTRYRLLETIREYSEERLVEHGETDALRDRHARYYTDYAWHCSEGLRGPEQIECGARMTADSENILAAFAHAVDTNNLDLAVRFLESTPPLNQQPGYQLLLPVDSVLAAAGAEQHPGYPLVLMAAASAADRRGEATLAREYGDAALDAERASTIARPYSLDLTATRSFVEGMIALSAGAWDDAATAYLEGAEHFRRADDLDRVSICLGSAASALCFGGRFADAIPLATDGLALAQGTPTLRSVNVVALAMAVSRQDPGRARMLLDEAAQRLPGSQNWGEAMQLTLAAAMIGDQLLAARFARRSIPLVHWVNHRPYLHILLTLAARTLADTDPEAAASIQGAADALIAPLANAAPTAAATAASTHGAPASGGGFIDDTRRETTRLLVEALGDERLRALRDHGSTMDTDAAVAYTLSRLDAFLTNTDD